MEQFIPGQRWYSDNEPELGLALVLSVEARQLRLHFPAIDEDRIYRLQDAPLTRFRSLPHESVFDIHGMKLHITSVEDNDGLLVYHGHDDQGHARQLPESELDSRLQLSRPRDRLLSGRIDPARLYQLRQTTRTMQNELLPDPARGLCGCRVDLIPHQLYIAHEVARRATPRVLLADEVGLGKTIEAGLIMHKQLLDERISRVLVLVPETLLHQWLVEMLRRFNLRFSLLDEARCEGLSEAGEKPFESEQLVLCSLDMFMRSPVYQQQVLDAEWDLLVVDEAHHLDWRLEQISPEYGFVEQLAARIPAVLLLTATPEQLGAAGHFARLRLLDPDRFFDLDEFLEEEDLYQPIIRAVNELLDDQPLSHASREAIHLALGQHPTFARLMSRAQQSDHHNPDRDKARQQLIHLLVDRHGTGRVLFRNTRAAISGFPERQRHVTPLPLPEAYASLASDISEPEQRLMPEQVWQQQADKPATWLTFDPRVEQAIAIVRQHRGEKFLLICAHADTAQALDKYLRERIGLRSTVFHEGLSIIERDRAAAYFADPEQGAQLLICSEIGSEGRNFQFAHHLLLFDLPGHPDLLEQRIGRLDRIGQTQVVQIHLLVFEHGPQQVLFRLYDQALNAFHRPSAAGATVFARFREAIDRLLLLPGDDVDQLSTLVNEAAACHQQLAQQLEQGRDRLLELNSYRREEADYIHRAITRLENDPRLLEYLETACDQFGVELEPHTADSHVMHPGTHMLMEQFPGLPDDGLTLTRSRNTALAREEWQFLSWEHPMIRGIMDRVLEDRHGNTALAVIRHGDYPAGTLLLECHYILEGTAPRRLQLPRYLPPTPVRRVVDPRGEDCTARFPADQLRLLPAELDKTTRQKILRARQSELRHMLDSAGALVEAPAREILASAEQRMRGLLDNEITRLQHLAQINPNVRQGEITQLTTQRDTLSRHIRQVQPVLDAARVLIVG
ncbi:RNA polymerase-associated protein RapA [Thiohalophilus thiocyanatoxydans]|uniref:RNA polymerase-associated protein RapA n=1 Tax=Thiohalophilus thiocyanatoxydans TaxID=381308 RepID=A0A4R8IER7_9GAMM|nr:RNA polymerase-associated protein RapA [Thiohalophilus thiocyanatoxydans]TDX97766.1 ATP-dependent helicase HepA [Thiohalophilus thiocyanatoxydans]